MAILNFMPQFVPWSTKALLKKKDDPDVAAATESTTGFFGDTFDFIDDAFDWTATAVEEPAIQYEEPPQYFDAPVAPPEPFYDVPPQYYDAPVQDTGFGSAIGDIFNGSGEGLGFDFIGEPTDSWTSQAPFEVPQADYNWDGGMGFDPVPPPAAPAYGFGEGIGDQFSNYFNWNSEVAPTPTPYAPAPDWGSMDIQPTEPPLLPQGDQPWMNLDFPDFGNTLTDWADPAPRYEDAVPMENPSAISSGLMDFPESDPMGWDDISSMFNAARPEPTPAPQTWDIPGMENPNTAIPGWFSMAPDERGEYVWQSGLPAESYLTDEDIAGMSDEVRFKLNFAENERGNISDWDVIKNAGQAVWDVTQGAANNFGQLGMDAFYDPIAGQINPAGLSSLRPNAQGGLSQLNVPEQEVMLDETLANARDFDVSDPLGSSWDFLAAQDQDYQDRPFSEQLMGQVFVPGNGLFGSVDDLPRGLAALEKGADLIQGGPLLGALGNIPGASTALKQVVLPGAVGAGGGFATEAIFDPTYTDQWGNEYDPGYAEMGLAGLGLGVGTKAATSAGTTPYGAGIKDVMKNFPVVSGTSKWGLPNQVKGDPGVNIEWEDPLDKALYQATSKSSAKTKPAVIALLKQHGISQSEINAAGEQIRARIAGIIDELSPRQGDTIFVEPVARAVVDEIPTVPTPIRQAATVEVPTVPSAITETQQERLVRLQQEVFASDPTAAAPFSAPGAVSPSVADEIPTVPTAPAAKDRYIETAWESGEQPGVFGSGPGIISRVGPDGAHYSVSEVPNSSGELWGDKVELTAEGWRGTQELGPFTSVEEATRAIDSQISGSVADEIPTVPATAAEDLLPGVRGIAQTMDDQSLPAIAGTTTYGLPNKKRVKLQWEDDIDKALYLASSGSNTNAANDAFRLLDSRGFTRADINEAGYMLRRHIDEATQGLSGGETIVVPKIVRANAGMADEISTVPVSISRAATSEIPTVPTGIADEVVTPAPSSPLVERTIEHIDAIRTARELGDPANETNLRKAQIEILNTPGLSTDEKRARMLGIKKGVYEAERPPLTEEEAKQLKTIVDAKVLAAPPGTYGPYVPVNASKAIEKLAAGVNPHPSEFDPLYAVLTDTPYQKAADDAIETVAPPKPTRAKKLKVITNGDMAREAAEAEARAGGIVEPDEVRRIGNTAVARLGSDATKPVADVIEPGMEKPIGETIDEIGTAKLAPEDKASIGADDELFPDIEDNNDWWQKAEDEYVPRNDGSGGDLPPIDDVGSGGEFQDTNDWWRGVTEKDAPSTGPKPEWKVLADDIADWRADNFKDFDAIDINAKSSWAQRKVGGALKNKLADTLTSRGRDLDMYLQAQGRTFEESKDMVERELADYLNARMMREAKNGNKNAILEHALTALHMGDFQPKMDGIKVPTGTGQVTGALQTARTANAALKNMFFGIADVSAIMGNAVPAIMNQGPMVGLAILNRMFKLVDLEDALKNREFSGLAMDQSQDVMSEDVGTLIGWAGRALGDKKGGAALRAIDRPFTKWNDVLSKAQFDLLMNKGLRQPAYEGNLVLLKLLGRDVNDPALQRAAARMANAATSTAPLARGNTRRAAEGATLSSARYLRAQGDLLLAATKLINPKASLDERIIAASTIASVIAVSAIANELAGNRLDLNPFKGVNVNPWKGDIDIKGAEFNPDFGKITLPDGTVVPFFRQKELAQTLLKTVAELDDLVKKDPTGIRDTWSRFIIGRTGPLGGTALKGLAKTGYDPVENTYSFPWEGDGFGSGMSPTQYALRMTPAPVGLLGLFDNKGTKLSKGLNIIGGGTYPQGDYSAALKKYGVDSMEEFEALDPDTFMTRKEKLYQENPELRAKFADTAVAKIEESKKFNSEDFMAGNRKIAQWRTYKDELAANKEGAFGAYGELGLEEKERPEKDGAAQWAWDYNQTFANAKTDHSNEFSETNRDVLGKLQAEFWAAHPDPKVRKEILEYQQLKAPTEADKLFARDMARLNGINPDTGEALTYPNGKPMPNFFTMDKYIWKEVPNDEAEEFRVGFDSWKNRQKGKVLELSVDKQIELYIETSKDVQTRANGKQWTPAAIKDVQNYGDKSKIRPLYTSYEEEMLPELLWFKPKQEWATIKEAHDNRE